MKAMSDSEIRARLRTLAPGARAPFLEILRMRKQVRCAVTDLRRGRLQTALTRLSNCRGEHLVLEDVDG